MRINLRGVAGWGMGDGGWESGKNKAYLRVPPAHRLPNISSQNKKYTLYLVSALIRFTPAPRTYCGRADNACTNLLGFFVRYVRTRGSMRLRRAAKPPIFTLSFIARTCHARLARLTRARRTRFGRRTARVLLADFWYFSSLKSTIKQKFLYISFRGRTMFDPCLDDANTHASHMC